MLKGKRVDPAAWREERLSKQLTTKVRRVREFRIAGPWFNSGFVAQLAKQAHTGTL